MLDIMWHGTRRKRRDQRVGHTVGNFLQVVDVDGVTSIPGKSGAPGVVLSGWIEPHDLAVFNHLQTAPDMDGRGGDDFALLDQAELRRASADIDIENALVLVAGDPRGAGAISRKHRFHVMAGGRGDEL